MKKALITGISGQDGSYLAEYLLTLGYEVHGLIRRNSSYISHPNLKNIESYVHLHYADLTDSTNIRNIINQVQPDEIYNLAAQSHVAVSFELPEYTADVDALGALRILDTIRSLGLTKKIRYYQASTSELFGKVRETPQTENTPFYPRSPYGCSKLFAHWITTNYRESYGIFACSGILFNHESPRRGENFVTRKITRQLARLAVGSTKSPVVLGNIDAKRDWGHAQDYVRAMHAMMQLDEPEDFVISTEQTQTVRTFCELAAAELGFDIVWTGTGIDERGHDKATGQLLVAISSDFYRPAEVELLLGDCSKARTKLNWHPEISFLSLVKDMVKSDLKLAQFEKDTA
jgi:GDPmannose 4,6-dehydratase